MWINHKYIYIFPPSWASFPPHHPTPLGHYKAPGWAPCVIQQLPLASYFTPGNVYISQLLSQFIPLSPSPAMSTSPFSTSASLFVPCTQVHQYHFSRFHICALIYDICFFSFWLTFLCKTDSRFAPLSLCMCVCVCVLVAQLCLTLCNPMDCSSPGSSVHGIL